VKLRWITALASLQALAATLLALTFAAGSQGATGSVEPPPASTTGAETPATAAPLPATHLTALPHSSIADGTQPLKITLSAPVSPTSPPPLLSPAVSGKWSIVGASQVFTPTSSLLPCTSYKLTVWARTQSTGYAQLGSKRTVELNVACPPLSALQQAFARLGYLGASFRPRYHFHFKPGRETPREAAESAFHPPRGRLAPEPSNAPPVQIGEMDATTRGAIEIFQEDNHLEVTGEPDRSTWLSLLSDVSAYKRDPRSYTWVQVSESLPETLWLHEGNHVVISTPVNTGVAGAETQTGIFPIYSRLVSTTMTGTDPDGTHYSVPDVPWVNYFNGGDAVHGYPRASYGFPQSNGCVELPIETAQRVFGRLAIGDIVWVQ
jgi:L,D-transpeptidase catalytic domain/Putative peptidoglycan binding domain